MHHLHGFYSLHSEESSAQYGDNNRVSSHISISWSSADKRLFLSETPIVSHCHRYVLVLRGISIIIARFVLACVSIHGRAILPRKHWLKPLPSEVLHWFWIYAAPLSLQHMISFLVNYCSPEIGSGFSRSMFARLMLVFISQQPL